MYYSYPSRYPLPEAAVSAHTGINFYAPDSGGDSADADVLAARAAADRALLGAAR